ncbi:DUF6059 family protein [Streptomyces sp. CA-249302]|uniref:DUF6059 family protein n=1 Tax=Streptomyces sp. CA-249302 TaxID=3240058 RepID=UPI003D93986A
MRTRKWMVEALMALGTSYMYGEAQQEVLYRLIGYRPAWPGRSEYLHEPPPGHPERLRPDIPLTADELWLGRQLTAAYTRADEEEGTRPA